MAYTKQAMLTTTVVTDGEIAQQCRVGASEVEHLVMKSMCADLIRGQIDEVNELVTVTWVKPRILDPATGRRFDWTALVNGGKTCGKAKGVG